MNIDPTGLEEVAKPGIENSLSHYKNAYSALKAIDLPSGAKTQYKEKISSIFANIEALMSEVIGDVDKYISDLKDTNISTEIIVENQDFSQNGNIAINNSGDEVEKKNPIEQFFSAGKESFGKFFGMLFGSATQNDVDLGKNISMAAEEVANSTMTEEEIEDFLVGAGGAAVNGGVAVVDGIATIFENAVDFLMRTGAYQTRQELENQAIWFDLTGNKGAAEASRKMGDVVIGATIEAVEKDYVEEGLDILYSQDFMKKINEGSYIKRGDNVYRVIEGVAYYIPITISEAVLPGSGIALSFAAGTGKADAEYLTQMKMNSKEGITSEYEEGNISEETYKFYQDVWKMSDEEYRAICLKKITGEITDEQFEYIENIRNMPEEWTTVENANKAMAGAGMIGAWESAQWAAGAGLNKITNVFGSKVAASGLRVGIDTGFNAADTGYRALVDTIVFGKEYGEAFEDRGGWVSTGISGAVGLLGSGIGEVFDWMKGNKKSNVFTSAGAGIESVDADGMRLEMPNTAIHGDTTMLLEGIEVFFEKQVGKKRSKLITELMKKDIESGKLDISKMTPNQLKMLAVDYDYLTVSKLGEIENNTIFKTYNALSWKFSGTPAGIRDEFFLQQQKHGLTYGTDQGSMQKKYHYVTSDGRIIEPGSDEYKQCINNGIELKIEKTADYINIREHMKTKYNLSNKDAERIIETMDVQGGICSNADFVNSIMYYRVQNQEIDDFDIPLYKDGKLNTDETLIDFFMYINDVKHGGNLFEVNLDGSLNFLENGNCMSLGTMRTSGRTTYKTDLVNSYLSSKGSSIRFSEPEQYNIKYSIDMDRIPIKEIDEALKRTDKAVSLSVKAETKIVFLDGSNTDVKLKDGSHIMTVTGFNRLGFIVDTWGKRGFISYDEFASKLGSISITTISK